MERATNSSLILYTTEDGLTKIEATFDRDTVWLSIDQMADLFQRNKSTISRHIGNIYKEGELDKAATVAKFATVQMEGERQVERQIEYYNLDVIISVGYRVKSQRGVQFRMWATAILKEFMKKGFVLDDDRLKISAAATTLMSCLPESGISGLLKRYSGGRCWRFMRPALIMTPRPKVPFCFSSRFKTKCIGQHTSIQRQRLSTKERMQKRSIWD